jgi:MYXO-CTERM domain-containing protein
MVDPIIELESGERVLLDSRVCPAISDALNPDGEGYTRFLGHDQKAAARTCFDESIVGPAQLDDDGCLLFDTIGEVTWELTPTGECQWSGDQLRFTVVAPSPELRLGFDDWRARGPERLGPDVEVIGIAPGRSLADFREDPTAPRLVIADAIDTPLMRLDDAEGRLFWSLADVPLELVGEAVTAVEPIDYPDPQADELQADGELPLRIELDGVARVRATLPNGQVLESPELIGVSSEAAASLDLVALVETGTGFPWYAFAEVRDAEGRVLHGAPVEWSMQTGALAVTPGNLTLETRTADYASLGTHCEPHSTVPIERNVVLRARFGGLEDTVELRWIDAAVDPELAGWPFEPDEACLYADDETEGETGSDDAGAELDDGCGCTSERETPGAWMLALIGLGLLRRRRTQS